MYNQPLKKATSQPLKVLKKSVKLKTSAPLKVKGKRPKKRVPKSGMMMLKKAAKPMM